MIKKLRLLSLFMAFILVFSACGASQETVSEPIDTESTDTTTTEESKPAEDTTASTGDYDDALIKSVESLYISDDDGDDTLGSDGDKQYTASQGEENFGLKTTFQLADSNENGTIEVGETLHVKFAIENNSDKDYTIQQVHIEGYSTIFDEGSITNLKTENTGEEVYEIDENRIKGTGAADYTLKAGNTATYEFDALIENNEHNVEKLKPDAYAKEYFAIEYMAYTGDEPTVYYSTEDMELNFSGETI